MASGSYSFTTPGNLQLKFGVKTPSTDTKGILIVCYKNGTPTDDNKIITFSLWGGLFGFESNYLLDTTTHVDFDFVLPKNKTWGFQLDLCGETAYLSYQDENGNKGRIIKVPNEVKMADVDYIVVKNTNGSVEDGLFVASVTGTNGGGCGPVRNYQAARNYVILLLVLLGSLSVIATGYGLTYASKRYLKKK